MLLKNSRVADSDVTKADSEFKQAETEVNEADMDVTALSEMWVQLPTLVTLNYRRYRCY